MDTKQKIWSGEIANKYPKQWVVFADIEYDSITHKYMGVVHLVTSDKKEAYANAKALGDSMGNITVIEGFNDKPHIGGLSAWSK